MNSTELTTYLDDYLGEVADILNLTENNPNSYIPVIYDTLLDCGETDPSISSPNASTITDLKKLIALAKANLWKHAMGWTAGKYKFSADGGSYDRNQLYEHCKANYIDAVNDALQYSSGNTIAIRKMEHEVDPYTYNPDRLSVREEI